MKMAIKRYSLTIFASFGLLAGLGMAQEEPEEVLEAAETFLDQLEEEVSPESSLLANTYQVIVDRNPFNLQPPAPPAPPKVEEEPEKEAVSLKELNITLAGVSAKSGDKRVWISMTLPPSQPEQKPVERFFGFRENDQQHGITVKSIEANGNVDIEYDGEPILLTFETHGNKKKAKPTKKPKNNVRTARTSSVPNRGTTARTGSGTTTRNTSANTARNRSVPVGRSANTARTIPARPVRTQPQQQLSRSEQVTLLEAQKVMAEKEGRPFPPLPPLRR
jgi:hypothetical protein